MIRAATAAFWLGLQFAGACVAQNAWPPAPPLSSVEIVESASLPKSIQAAWDEGRWKTTFRYKPDVAAKSVGLAGTFNGWNPAATPMLGPDADGTWTADRLLPSGEHFYKFVVDGQRWFHDPLNSASIPDGQGGQNSVLRLGRLASLQQSPAKLDDDAIDACGLEHDPTAARYLQAVATDRALIRYRTLAHDVRRAWVAIRGGGLTEMRVELEGPVLALWSAEMQYPRSATAWDRSESARLEYTFVLEDGKTRVSDPKTYKAELSEADIFHTPEWARHAIWYQIFPERFRNGDSSNDPTPTRPWTSDWFSTSDFETKTGQQFYKWFVYSRFYGGDLQGIEQKLGYLKDLGVNALYLNPIFKAPTNHKYNATNYLHVDDHFGVKGDYEAIAATEDLNDPKTWKWTESDKLFLAFLKKAKGMGFRVIIDGVFNHVGPDHPAFVNVRKNGQKSKYANWFNVVSWEPFKWRGWFGNDDLPEFKKSQTGLASEAAKQHIFNVTRRWMDPNGDGDPGDGIDGWRLDVPNEIPLPFWVEWRKLVKSINPDAYTTGEIWWDAAEWLDGRKFDAVMNYPVARAAIAWIGDKRRKITVSECDRRLAELRVAYPAAATYVMQNLVDSHDTDRLVSMLFNPDREYDQENRAQDNGPNYDNHKPNAECYQRARLIALFQMTYVGAPMVYYGDEVGMWGADDPTCRKPMLWEDLQPYEKPEENFVMKDHLEFYKRAIALRNAHPALRSGCFHTLLADDGGDVWAFERGDASEVLIIALNASDQMREVAVPIAADAPQSFATVFGDGGEKRVENGKLSIKIPALAGVVLQGARRS